MNTRKSFRILRINSKERSKSSSLRIKHCSREQMTKEIEISFVSSEEISMRARDVPRTFCKRPTKPDENVIP